MLPLVLAGLVAGLAGAVGLADAGTVAFALLRVAPLPAGAVGSGGLGRVLLVLAESRPGVLPVKCCRRCLGTY